MKRVPFRAFTLVLLCAFLLTAVRPAKASIPTGTQVVLIFVAVGAIGAALGVGIYYAVRRSPSLTGCTASGSGGGLTLHNEGDQQTFSLTGDTATIKSGDRIRVQGRKNKDSSGNHTFRVDKLSRDFGPCKVPVTP